MRRRLTLAAGILVVLALAVGFGFGPLVRARAEGAASRYGATLEIGRVRPTLRGARLLDVAVRVPELPFAQVRIDEVEAFVGLGLGVSRVAVRGGSVSLQGTPSEVAERIRAFRAAHAAAGGPTGGGGREVSVEGVGLSWSGVLDGADPLVVQGVSYAREGESAVVGADLVSFSRGGSRAVVRGARVGIVREGEQRRLGRVRAEGVTLVLDLGEPRQEPAGGAPSAVLPAATTVGERLGKLSPLGRERGARLRERVVGLAALSADVLSADADVEISGLHAEISRGDQKLNVGPGRLKVVRDGDRVVMDLIPGGEGGPSPLTLHASVPTGAGEIVVDVRGGPVTLASLGAHENDFGLVDVGKATLDARLHAVLAADARSVSFDGEGRLRSLAVANKKLANDTVRGIDLSWRATGAAELDGSMLRLDDAEVDLGAIRMQGLGLLERGDEFVRARGRFTVPLASCQAMLDSVPRALVPKLVGTTMSGTYALAGKLAFDSRRMEDMQLDWDVGNTCRVTSVPPEIDVARFAHPFRRMAYDADGNKTEITSGPGSAGWVPLAAISPFMEASVTTTEDGGFRRHHGFDKEAIKNSVRDNLKTGKFLRGASTISMQLAKNLYLDREKTLSRKMQEAVLTTYLEQELTKDQLLELYFNVVELGPMIYGVGPAAEYYFNTSANDLSLGQALYLSSILPNPKKQYFGAGGRVAPGWMGYLHKLMKLMLEHHRISEDELAFGLSEVVTYHVARSPRLGRPDESVADPDSDPGWVPPDAP